MAAKRMTLSAVEGLSRKKNFNVLVVKAREPEAEIKHKGYQGHLSK